MAREPSTDGFFLLANHFANQPKEVSCAVRVFAAAADEFASVTIERSLKKRIAFAGLCCKIK